MPWPSADTVILGQRAVLFTWKVPSARRGQDLRQAPSSQAKGTFICKRSTAADHRRKPEAKVARAAAAAGTSSGLGLQLERHLAVRVDLSVERLVVEGSGSIGLHEHLHVGFLDDLVAGLRAIRQRERQPAGAAV